jgi:hypothetical protein
VLKNRLVRMSAVVGSWSWALTFVMNFVLVANASSQNSCAVVPVARVNAAPMST